MGAKTGINWTDATWNPVTGCTPAGVGCAHCYAKRVAERFQAVHGVEFSSESLTSTATRPVPFSTVICHPERLTIPERWRKPRAIMCPSMGDLFHKDVPDAFIADVLQIMSMCRHHTFIVLTKRPDRMAAFLNGCQKDGRGWVTHNGRPSSDSGGDGIVITGDNRWPLPNVVLGVSCSTQAEADHAFPILLDTKANRRIVSLEPLVGPVIVPREYLFALDGVIVGGESGPGARPMHPDWVRSLRDQCAASGVPFFFKQWGVGLKKESFPVRFYASTAGWHSFVQNGGRELDGRTHDELCWAVRGKGAE